jgi:hypothetical protein
MCVLVVICVRVLGGSDELLLLHRRELLLALPGLRFWHCVRAQRPQGEVDMWRSAPASDCVGLQAFVDDAAYGTALAHTQQFHPIMTTMRL